MQNDEKSQFLAEIKKSLQLEATRQSPETEEEVAECLDAYTLAEMGAARERALIRYAWRFKHLLGPEMQRILEARYTQDGEERKGSQEKRELILDDLYGADDPEVERTFYAFLGEAEETAHERALVRVAWEFKHLLSPRMRKVLEVQYPQPESV